MKIRWTPAAAVDLQDISDYLETRYPHFRHATLRKLYASVQSLKTMPHRGRPGREEGTRELVLTPLPYIAIYVVGEQGIEVLRVYHGARQFTGRDEGRLLE
jgi:toxin ParE1/3/4